MTEANSKLTCADCDVQFKSLRNLLLHQKRGVCKRSSLTCVCGMVFSCRQRKYDHRKRNPNCNVLHPENNGASTSASSTAPDLKKSLTPAKSKRIKSMEGVHDFFETDLNIVVEYFKNDPSALITAFKQGCLHEKILSVIHFTGAQENKNIFNVERTGKYMDIKASNMRMSIEKKVGLERTLYHVRYVANHPDVQCHLTTLPNLPIPENLDNRTKRLIRIKHEIVILNRGKFLIQGNPYQIIGKENEEEREEDNLEEKVNDEENVEDEEDKGNDTGNDEGKEEDVDPIQDNDSNNDASSSTTSDNLEPKILPTKRRKITGIVRNRIYHRQRGCCNICETELYHSYHVDHITPLCDGGADVEDNLQGLCVPCHTNKTARESQLRSGVDESSMFPLPTKSTVSKESSVQLKIEIEKTRQKELDVELLKIQASKDVEVLKLQLELAKLQAKH